MSGEIKGWQLEDVRRGMLWDMSFCRAIAPGGVTKREWLGMEADRAPVRDGFWDCLMNLVNDWDEEQRSRSPFH